MVVSGIAPWDPVREATTNSLLLGTLPTDDLEAILNVGRGLRGDRGRVLRHSTEDSVVVIFDGVVTTRMITDDGQQLISGVHGAGVTLGMPVVLGHAEAGEETIALTPFEAMKLPGAALRRLINERAAVARGCLRVLTAEVAALREEQARFAGTSTGQRVVLRLVELAERFGEPDLEEGRVRIRIPLTQDELASWAHASRESTARQLQTLRRAGVLRTARRELTILDLPGLRARTPNGGADPMLRRVLRGIG